MKFFCEQIPFLASSRRCGMCGAESKYYVYLADDKGEIDRSTRRRLCQRHKEQIFKKPEPEPEHGATGGAIN